MEMKPVVEPSARKVNEIARGPRDSVEEDLGAEASEAGLERRHWVGVRSIRRISRFGLLPFPAHVHLYQKAGPEVDSAGRCAVRCS